MNDSYAVVEHNQASGQPVGDFVSFCISLTEAVGERDRLTEQNRSNGRREQYAIYRLEEVDDEELHDWAIQGPDGAIHSIPYFDYSARRDCPAGHAVVKRRLGAKDWIPAPEEEN